MFDLSKAEAETKDIKFFEITYHQLICLFEWLLFVRGLGFISDTIVIEQINALSQPSTNMDTVTNDARLEKEVSDNSIRCLA